MQRLEVSDAVRPLYESLGVRGLISLCMPQSVLIGVSGETYVVGTGKSRCSSVVCSLLHPCIMFRRYLRREPIQE
jgi:hypothetical protein